MMSVNDDDDNLHCRTSSSLSCLCCTYIMSTTTVEWYCCCISCCWHIVKQSRQWMVLMVFLFDFPSFLFSVGNSWSFSLCHHQTAAATIGQPDTECHGIHLFVIITISMVMYAYGVLTLYNFIIFSNSTTTKTTTRHNNEEHYEQITMLADLKKKNNSNRHVISILGKFEWFFFILSNNKSPWPVLLFFHI